MKYNIDHFLEFFGDPAKKWTMHSLKKIDGSCCALGHFNRFHCERQAENDEEAQALAGIILDVLKKDYNFTPKGKSAAAHLLIPIINDGGKLIGESIFDTTVLGEGPKERIMHLLNKYKERCTRISQESRETV